MISDSNTDYMIDLDCLTYSLCEITVSRRFPNNQYKDEITESIFELIVDGTTPLLWDTLDEEMQEFYVYTASVLLNHRYNLMINEDAEYLKNALRQVESLNEFVVIPMLNVIGAILQPLSFLISYHSIENRIGICRNFKDERKWRCQLSALASVKSMLRASQGKCTQQENPEMCKTKVEKAVARIEAQIDKARQRMAIMNNANGTTYNRGAKLGEASKEVFGSVAATAAGVGVAMSRHAVANKITGALSNASKVVAAAQSTDSVSLAQRAFDMARNVFVHGNTITTVGNIANVMGPMIAAQALTALALRILTKNRIQACNSFEGKEKLQCRVRTIEAMIREINKFKSECRGDKRCVSKVERQLKSAANQLADAKVKYANSLEQERIKSNG